MKPDVPRNGCSKPASRGMTPCSVSTFWPVLGPRATRELHAAACNGLRVRLSAESALLLATYVLDLLFDQSAAQGERLHHAGDDLMQHRLQRGVFRKTARVATVGLSRRNLVSLPMDVMFVPLGLRDNEQVAREPSLVDSSRPDRFLVGRGSPPCAACHDPVKRKTKNESSPINTRRHLAARLVCE